MMLTSTEMHQLSGRPQWLIPEAPTAPSMNCSLMQAFLMKLDKLLSLSHSLAELKAQRIAGKRKAIV